MADLTGMTLGPYRIVEQIGRGGMATVYKAYHAAMDRHVALKILPEEYADEPGFRERFEREAKTVAKLQHPHILPVFDYGEERNISYLVMPYIPTGTLKAYMAQHGALPLDEAARIFTRLAEALDYAHSQNILHRDIKPGNVLFDERGNALLTDFGLTRMVGGDSSLTGSSVIGTPAYMSPEQGQGKPIDHRSDIYAMGIILYEMVTGMVPFSADTPIAVIFKHITEPLPMPTSKRPDLPEAAQNVILKALSKEPEQRYDSCVKMAEAFSRAVADAVPDAAPGASPAAPVTPTAPSQDIEAGGATVAGAQPVPTRPAAGGETEQIPPEKLSVPPEKETVPPEKRRVPVRGMTLIGAALIALIAVPALVVFALHDRNKPGYSADHPITHNADWKPDAQVFDGVEMVLVPTGCFMMGNDPEAYTGSTDGGEQCFDAPFWIDRYEVTNAQYRQCVDAGACSLPHDTSYYDDPSFADSPVVNVDWFQARDYATWRGGRLPTEAEWEYAARGPDGLIFPWGNEFAWDNVAGNASDPAEVGSHSGGVGWIDAYDLSGNVWEWTSSIYWDYPYVGDDGREDGSDTSSNRVLRSSPWDSSDPNEYRAANRHEYEPGGYHVTQGIRTVRAHDGG